MVNIIHRVGIQVPASKVYSAISTVEGISSWWTQHTTTNPNLQTSALDTSVEARFYSPVGEILGTMKMEVTRLDIEDRVRWKFIAGPQEWLGTVVDFKIKQEGSMSIVLFSHENWQEANEFMAHCSMKWATFLLSLKAWCETGVGKPSPVDVKIDNWN